ncbi:MAG: hypothetical protein ACPG4K_05835 [Haloferula sp.]
MRTRLTNILGLVLIGVAVVMVMRRGDTNPDSVTGDARTKETSNLKRMVPDRTGHEPTRLTRSSERKSAEELIQEAESLYREGNYEAAFELATIAMDRAPEDWVSLPFQLSGFMNVMKGDPVYVGRILTAKDPTQGSFLMSTELTPSRIVHIKSLTGTEEGTPFETGGDQGPLVVHYSVENMGEFRKGDVVEVWAGALKLSNPPQANAFRIKKVK